MTIKGLLCKTIDTQKEVAYQYIKKKSNEEYWKEMISASSTIEQIIENTENETIIYQTLRELLTTAKKKLKKKREQEHKNEHLAMSDLCELLLTRFPTKGDECNSCQQ